MCLYILKFNLMKTSVYICFRAILFAGLMMFYLPAHAQCNNGSIEPTVFCDDAPVVAYLDGYCGSLRQPTGAFSATICGQGISLDNPSWFSFIATSTTVAVTITPSNCQHAGGNVGIQGAIVSTCPPPFGGGNYATVGTCAAGCMVGTFTLGVGGTFVVGRQYWVMLDGCAGDICDFEITATQGITAPLLADPTEITGPSTMCAGETAMFTVDEPGFAAAFYWLVDGEDRTTSSRSIEVTIPPGTPDGIYRVCLYNAENALYSLIDDNDYEGDVCIEVQVVNLPVTDLPDVVWCSEAGTYEVDGFSFYPPSGQKTYQLSSSAGCDSILSFHITFIEYELPHDTIILCTEDLPYEHAELGWIESPGDYGTRVTDEHGCDSTTYTRVRAIEAQCDVQLSSTVLECPSDEILADVTNCVAQLSDGTEIVNVQDEWQRYGVPLDRPGSSLAIWEPGEYDHFRTVEYGGVICTSASSFTIEDNRIAPSVPVIDSPQSGDEGDTITVSLTNWDSTSVISWQQGEGYEILSGQGTAEVLLRLVKELQDTICVTVHKRGCALLSSEACEPITILGVNAVGEPGKLALLEVYPNPAGDHIYISSPLHGRAELLSTDGRVLRQVTLASPDRQMIHTGDLPGGVYTVRLVTSREVHSVPVAILR